MAAVDARSWPVPLAANAETFLARILTYGEGQLVAEAAGRIVATASAQRVTQAFLDANCRSYHLLTDGGRFTRSHDSDGEIYQLVGVGVLPEFRGRHYGRLGRELVDRQIAFARGLPGVRRILGFTRPAGYHRRPELSIDEYLAARGPDGRLLDPVVGFHVEPSRGADFPVCHKETQRQTGMSAPRPDEPGARIVSIHPDFRPEDDEARGYGVLIEYPVS